MWCSIRLRRCSHRSRPPGSQIQAPALGGIVRCQQFPVRVPITDQLANVMRDVCLDIINLFSLVLMLWDWVLSYGLQFTLSGGCPYGCMTRGQARCICNSEFWQYILYQQPLLHSLAFVGPVSMWAVLENRNPQIDQHSEPMENLAPFLAMRTLTDEA